MKPGGAPAFATGLVAGVMLLGLLAAAAARADETPSAADPEAAIRYSQSVIGRQVADHRFSATDGSQVSLAAFRGKPLVVSLIYTACTDVCPMIVQTLYDAVEVAQDALGPDSFAVVTVGFDTQNDTPDRMRAYARGQGVDLPNWHFLSTDPATISRVVKDLGFIFYASPKGFDHLAQTTVIDGEGRIYRHVYGADFESPALVEPLKDLVFGRGAAISGIGDLIDRLRLFCTIYDPNSNHYRFDYSIFIGLAIGLLSLGGIAVILVRAWLRTVSREGKTAVR